MKLFAIKYILFFALLVSSFSWASSVFALTIQDVTLPEITIDCDPPPAGWKNAVFIVTSDDTFGPPSADQYCVRIPETKNAAYFVDLAEAGAIDQAWQAADTDREVNYCDAPNGKLVFGTSPSTRADATEFSFQTDLGVCPFKLFVDGENREVKQHIRWRLSASGGRGRLYVYYLGIHNGPIATEDCRTFTTRDACVGMHPSGQNVNCFWANSACLSKVDRTICSQLTYQDDCLLSDACAWNNNIRQCITALEQNLANGNQTPGGYAWALPPCAFEGSCRNVNDVLQVAVTYAKGIFGLLGAAGLLFFIYGGITIVMSMGSSDKVSKGKDIIMAAVIGLIICFSAYIAVDFILDALQVGPEFRQIGTLDTPETK